MRYQVVPKKVGRGTHLKSFGNSIYRPSKNRLRAAAARAIHDGTELLSMVHDPAIRSCFMMFAISCFFNCPNGYLHVQKNSISILELEHFL